LRRRLHSDRGGVLVRTGSERRRKPGDTTHNCQTADRSGAEKSLLLYLLALHTLAPPLAVMYSAMSSRILMLIQPD
jgi:hypothetical protein